MFRFLGARFEADGPDGGADSVLPRLASGWSVRAIPLGWSQCRCDLTTFGGRGKSLWQQLSCWSRRMQWQRGTQVLGRIGRQGRRANFFSPSPSANPAGVEEGHLVLTKVSFFLMEGHLLEQVFAT
jgi:hypothetical protein